jgi:hypothetical protein
MESQPECYDCALRMVTTCAELLNFSADNTSVAIARAREFLDTRSTKYPPPENVRPLFAIMQEIAGIAPADFDPYRELKRVSNEQVKPHLDALRRLVAGATDPLDMALQVAAAGNTIDFGAHHYSTIDIDAEIARIPEMRFAVCDSDRFKADLAEARRILYIGDNAGEVFFNRVLIEEILRARGDVFVAYAVRSRPILNDATREDAQAAGIQEVAPVVSTGCACPGVSLTQTSLEFRRLFALADIVISKGQGNYETLHQTNDSRIYYMLRVKCACVSRLIGAALGDLVLKRG